MIYRFNTNIWNKPIDTCFPRQGPYCFHAKQKGISEAQGPSCFACQAIINDSGSTTKLCYFYCKDDALKTTNRVNTPLSVFNKKRVSIRRIVLCKANPSSNLSERKSLNTINKRGLNLWFKRKKRIISCFAYEGENDSSPMPEKNSKTQAGLSGPSIWIVDKVQSLTEKLLHTKNFSPTSDKKLKIIPNKSRNQKESKLYTFGLASHYQLQKNISKIEIGLRQGCQLFTVYVFGSFCWLYLIKYSSKTNELVSGQVDFLFQDILFETLPLLSKKESLTNKETINYANNPIKKEKSINETSVSIELTPLFSEQLQNYIGKKPKKSYQESKLNSANFEPTELSEKTKGSNEIGTRNARPLDSTINVIDSNVFPKEKTYEYFSKNLEKNKKSLKTGAVEPDSTIVAQHENSDNLKYSKTIGGQNTKLSKSTICEKEIVSLYESSSPSKENNKVNQNKTLLAQSFSFLGSPAQRTNLPENLIFFARKPIFIKEISEGRSSVTEGLRQSILDFLFFKKQSLTQKNAYDLSGTSVVIDSEIDSLPRKLEEIRFSKIGSLSKAKILGQIGLAPDLFSLNFKPHLTLTESLLWCKTLTKSKIPLVSGHTESVKIKTDQCFQSKNCMDRPFSSKASWLLKHEAIVHPLEIANYEKQNLKIPETWFDNNSFEGKFLPNHLSLVQKQLLKNLVVHGSGPGPWPKGNGTIKDCGSTTKGTLLKRIVTQQKKGTGSLRPLDQGAQSSSLNPVQVKLGKKGNKKQDHLATLLLHKNLYSTGLYNKQTVNEELLLQHLFLKTGNLKSKGLTLSLDIFKEPRLQSGFQFPNATIFDKNKAKLKEGLGITISPRFLFSKDHISWPTAQRERYLKGLLVNNKGNGTIVDCGSTRALIKKQENKSKFLLNSTRENNPFSVENPVHLSKESSLSLSSILQAQENKNEKDFFDTNTFLEWLYEPNPKPEYLFYSRANEKLINLQKKTSPSLFVVLDKHTDLKTKNCFVEKNLLAPKINHTFVEKVFSYKRNSFTGLLDAPENFFGTPYLKLGERFTIEKLKSKNKMGTFYSIHNGEWSFPWKKTSKGSWPVGLAPVNEANQPYASMGTSLKTVFGKKQFTTPQNQTSKKISKVQNLITNARLVTNWSRDYKAQDLCKNSFSNEIQDNNFFFPREKENKISSLSDSTNSTPKSSNSNQISQNQTNNVLLNKAKILKLSYFKRISGKANRNITLPFKYYNPGIKRERNIEDTMLILEGYKKSRLFPTIHNDYRGIAYPLPITIGTDKGFFHELRLTCEAKRVVEPQSRIVAFPLGHGLDSLSHEAPTPLVVQRTNQEQDYELQSILLGMRQRTETQRIALNLSDPSSSVSSKEQSEKELPFSSTKDKERFGQKHIKQNKKSGLSNYYPLVSSLAVCPQEAFPIKALGNTNINLYNNSKIKPQTFDLKGSIQTKGFYFEKLSCSESLPFFNVISFLNQNGVLISPNFLAKIIFFAVTWYSYKLLATPLSQSTQFLPATFTEAIGLQSFQQKYRIIKGEKKLSFSFKNIAGAEKTLSELRDLIWTFRLVGTQSSNRKDNLFTLFPYIGSRFGQSRQSVLSKSRNRLLLAGPPGTGKTLLVKALAAEANLPVIVQPVSSLRMISGVENPVSALFHVARQIKPCIIFLDELDTLGNDINSNTNNYTAEQKLGIRLARKYTYTLLLELDGLTSSTKDLLIIGATNRLETLNPALTRAGRFDTILDFNLPSQEALSALFSFYLGKTLFLNNQEATKEPKETKRTLSLVRQKPRNYFKEINFKLKKSKDSFSLESYLAGKCYGLSHASISTIINESALESMLSTDKTVQRSSRQVRRFELPNSKSQAPWLKGSVNFMTQRIKSMAQRANSSFLGLNTINNSSSTTKKPSSTEHGHEAQNPSTNKVTQQSSIFGTVIKPYHTLDTLERAINSVKTLTRSKHSAVNTTSLVESDNNLSFNSSLVPAHQKPQATALSTLPSKGLDRDQAFRLIKPFNYEFLVSRAYQTVGSLIFYKKSQEFSSIKPAKPFSKTSSLIRKSYLAINQNNRPVTRKDLQNVLLQEYSGYASVSIYTSLKPLTFKITRTGLYQDPSYIAATLSTLRILTVQSSVSRDTKMFSSFASALNQKMASHFAFEDLFSGFVKESNLPKVFFSNTCGQMGHKTPSSGEAGPKGVSLAQGPKGRSSNALLNGAFSLKTMLGQVNEPNLDSSYADQIEEKQKQSLLFWQTKANLKSKRFSSNSGFNKYNKQGLTHIMDVKAANPLTTSWFRIYFSRPFFRYDTFHYIENKEYFPKNNYILKRNTLFQRNVSTLSHTKTLCNSPLDSLTGLLSRKAKKPEPAKWPYLRSTTGSLNLKNKTLAFLTKETTEKKGKAWSKDTKQVISSFLNSAYYPELGKQARIFNVKESFAKKRELNYSSETQESLYLAIVASIFHKSIQFFEKNRELTDYCAYTFLRYGVLYDFYLEAILRKF